MIVEVQNRHLGHSEGSHFEAGSRCLGGMGHVRMVMQGPLQVVEALRGLGASSKEVKSISRAARIW